MMMREAIEFDFIKAKKQADRIDTIANNLGKLSGKELRDTLQSLSANWKGENASLYLSKGSALQGKMNKTVKELHAVAADIRMIAKRLYDAEMASLAIASARDYS